MKRQTKHKYLGTRFNAVPKHAGTYPFSKGNEVPEMDRIPAYSGSGTKAVKKKLPPMRDLTDIDLQALTFAINKIAPGNNPSFYGSTLTLNSTDITIKNGICRTKKLVFRYTDVKDLVKNLRTENLLLCNGNQIFYIEVNYKKNVHHK